MRILLGLFFLLIAPQIFAGPFDPPATDQSVAILGTIFGNTVGDLYLGGGSNPVLYQMIEKLNFTIIAIGAIIVSYVAVTSVIHTSHEGSMLGKSWSSLWIPLRSIIGMSLLVPTPTTGYCLIQVGVMWLVLQGVGIADELWTIAMDGLADGVSATVGTMTNQNIIPVGEAIAPNLLDATICMQSVLKLADPNGISYVYTQGTQIHSFDEIQNNITSKGPIPYTFGTDNDGAYATVKGTMYFGFENPNLAPEAKRVCGSTLISATVRIKEYPKPIRDLYTSQSQTGLENLLAQQAMLIYKTKTNAYYQIIGILKQVAQGYVNGTYAPPNLPNSLLPPAPTGALRDASSAYASAMSSLVVPSGAKETSGANAATTAITQTTQITGIAGQLINAPTAITTSITDASQATKDIIKAGNEAGWISAGSFYFILNKTMIATQFSSAEDPYNAANFDIPSCGATQNSGCLNGIKTYAIGTPENAAILNANTDPGDDRTFIAQNLAYGRLYTAQETGIDIASGTISTTSASALSLLVDWNSLNTNVTNIMSGIFNGDIQNMDPLLAHAKFGRVIMAGCESVILNVIAMRVLSAIFAFKPSTGLSSHAVMSFVVGVLLLLMPLLAMMWSFGAILAVYCPLIPFMFFAVGALGWFITVVEAIISAPIIAVGLLLPAGEDLGRTQDAMMILANLFFRPALMIIGFIFAGKLYKAFVILVDVGMGPIFQTINVTTTFSIVIVVVVYVSLILSATNLCFALIYALPDRLLRWIGGHAEHTDAGPIDQIKGAAQGAAGEVGRGLSEAGKIGIKSTGKSISETAKMITQGGKKNK